MIARNRIYCFRFLSDNQCLSHADYRRDTRAIACVYHPVYSKSKMRAKWCSPFCVSLRVLRENNVFSLRKSGLCVNYQGSSNTFYYASAWFLLVVFICRCASATLLFAKSNVIVHEEQRCRSRTANNFALQKMQMCTSFFKKRKCDFNVSLIYRCCQDASKVAQLSQVNISAICHPEQREGSRAGTLQETLRDASHSFSMTESIRIQKHRRFHLRNLSKVESDHP